MKINKRQQIIRRRGRVRIKIKGTNSRPRLCLYRGSRSLIAQIIDDTAGKTLLYLTDRPPATKGQAKPAIDRASALGQKISEQAIALGITQVLFDRGGFRYHGRVRAFAEAARLAGLKF